MTIEAKLEKMLADAGREVEECGVLASDIKLRLDQCMDHVQSGKSRRLVLGKFIGAKRDRERMERLMSRMNAKLKVVDEMIKKHSGEVSPERAKEMSDSTVSFLAILDGLHRTCGDPEC